jgi:hypothetical protein
VNKKYTKRELIEPHKGDKRYIQRIEKGLPGAGQIAKSVNLSKSLSRDDRIKAKHVAKPGYGNRGDEKRR